MPTIDDYAQALEEARRVHGRYGWMRTVRRPSDAAPRTRAQKNLAKIRGLQKRLRGQPSRVTS